MDFELVIANGTLVDGTGRPRFHADLGLHDGRIAAICPGERLAGSQMLDAAGLIGGQIVARDGQAVAGERRGRILRRG